MSGFTGKEVTALVISLVALVLNYLNYRKITKVHVEINSRMTELLKVTGLSEYLRGGKDERQTDQRTSRLREQSKHV